MANRIAQTACAREMAAGTGDDQNLEKEQKNAGVAAKKIDTKKKGERNE